MAEFTVTAGELNAKAAELERLNRQLEQKIIRLQAEESALKTMWEGEAKAAFSASFARDKGKMTHFLEEIGKYIRTLRMIAAKYEAAERKNTAAAGSKG